jgi:two-component system nitrogen regulation sensor histidine kinase NtrY
MNGKKFRIVLLVLTIIFVLVSIIAESVYFSDYEYHLRTRLFNRNLNSREKLLEDCLEGMRPILAVEDHHGSMPEKNLFALAEENKITILEFLDNKLAYWSDNGFNVPSLLNDSTYNKPLVFLQNGWFLTRSVEAGNEKIVGLLRLRTDYSFDNDIIKSGFGKEYRVPENVSLSTDKNASEFHIKDRYGRFLFTLVFPDVKENTYFILVPLCLWTATFFLIILLALELVKLLVNKGKPILSIISLLIFFIIFYTVFLISSLPAVFFKTELFSPYRFSLNSLIPTLGHLVLSGILTAVFSGVCFRYFPLAERQIPNGKKNFLFLTGSLIAAACMISIIHFMFSNLISTSNINFETYKVLEMSLFTVAGFVSVLFLILAPVLLLIRILRSARLIDHLTFSLSVIPSLFFLVIIFRKDPDTLIPLEMFYLVIVGSIWLIEKYRVGLFNMTVIFSLIYGLYSLWFITVLSEEKSIENIKIQAVSLSSENDPEAENLLLNMWQKVSSDTILSGLMKVQYFSKGDVDDISDYLQNTYFTGYWRNFSFRIVCCRNDEPLQVGPNSEMAGNCFSFFDNRIKLDGHQLTGTGFYFMDNQGGRSYYLGRLFGKTDGNFMNGLFIELYSDINVFQPGYSSILLDKRYHGYSGLKDYSYAKYLNGEIVLRTGEFPFNKTDNEYIKDVSDYRIFRADGFKHVLYKNGNATVIISRPYLTTGDNVISFAYLFAFILLFSNLVILVIRRPVVRGMNLFNFRQKLQLSYIGILLFSFILIGIVVAYLTFNQYQSKHHENIKEKLNSIYLELDGKLSMEKHLSNNWSSAGYTSLDELLIKLSNVFNTDINLYDLTGNLISTSRPEIFYRDLTSSRINNIALINLDDFSRAEYFQKEKIGNLEYLSAYIPFMNAENKVLAYLNLPYFRMQSVLAREISNLIVAVINFTLLLIVITMSIAVFISGRLTAPLTMLSEGLESVEVGKKSEPLKYKGNDEIGELVKKYNVMVKEIEESTYKLANSEREYAWREMAKQIAHEIKNPLTPMKLNVQQLLKSWNDNVTGFGEKLEQFTKNQIEYIDNLSSIASAFSAFAKMPGTNPVEVNLIDQLKITLELFKDSDNTSFDVEWPRENKIIVYADKEHLNGVFSNLIKNGIQSVPQERSGKIKVNLEIRSNKAIVAISDNGTGISEELQKKLFTPNFTTKSSGMGLGLSIVKKYIESANGRIWFESEADKGTTFFVELPLKYTVET